MAELLGVPVLPYLPLGLVLLLAAPLTGLLSRRPLRLVRFGGALVVSLDSAVLALVLWTALLLSAGGPVGAGAPTSQVVLGLLALVPWITGYAAAEAFARQRRATVRAYNVLLSAVAGGLFVVVALSTRAWVAVGLTGDPVPARLGPWDVAAVLLGSIVYVTTDLVLSAGWVARVEGTSLWRALLDPAALVACGTVLAVNVTGVLAAVLLVGQPWGLLLLVPVAVALVHATATSTVALTEHSRAQAMYAAAEGCQAASSPDDVRAAVLRAAEEATSAPAAIRPEPPDEGQEGGFFVDGDEEHWLVVGPRANGNAFDAEDRSAVATLAAMCGQSLGRLADQQRIRWLAEHDTMTGLLNRRAFLETAAGLLVPDSALLFCDVDRFKSVNDTLGHRAGDEVLIGLARALVQVVGDEGVVGRLGGDEFVVLLPATTPQRLEETAAAIAEAARAPLGAPGEDLGVGLSIGVATVRDMPRAGAGLRQEQLAEALLDRADDRMYGEKQHRPGLRVR